jgi:hypothetical protein
VSIITTPGAPPIFLSVPYVNSFSDAAGQIVATSMQGIVHRSCQLDPTAYWQGSLGASDSDTEVITMGLYFGSLNINVSIDTIILLNHNLNDFLVEYCTDYTPGTGGAAGTGTWQTLVNVTGQAGVDYAYFASSPIANVSGLRLTMTTTSPGNLQKSLGNFIAALSTFQLSVPSSKIKYGFRQRRVDVQLADGTIDSTFLNWSDNSFTLTDIDFEIDFANVYAATDKTNLDALFQSGQSFLFYAEPGDVSRNIYLGLFDPKSYSPDYMSLWKGGGRKLPFKVMQIGYY